MEREQPQTRLVICAPRACIALVLVASATVFTGCSSRPAGAVDAASARDIDALTTRNLGDSASLVFHGPGLRVTSGPEDSRADARLSPRDDLGLVTTRWPSPEPPRERRIPTIYSFWGRSY